VATYEANPVRVEAWRVLQVGTPEASGTPLILENGDAMTATPEMLARMTPAPGDYWVEQADGYVYLNPREVFERKYRPVATLDET
jgi:hypothetical protein